MTFKNAVRLEVADRTVAIARTRKATPIKVANAADQQSGNYAKPEVR
jgi:hypothetical protein